MRFSPLHLTTGIIFVSAFFYMVQIGASQAADVTCSDPQQFAVSPDHIKACGGRPYPLGDEATPGDARAMLCFQDLPAEDLRGYDPCAVLQNNLDRTRADLDTALNKAASLWASFAWSFMPPVEGTLSIWGQRDVVGSMMSDAAWQALIAPRLVRNGSAIGAPYGEWINEGLWQMAVLQPSTVKIIRSPDQPPTWTVVGELQISRRPMFSGERSDGTNPAGDVIGEETLALSLGGYFSAQHVSEFNPAGVVVDRVEVGKREIE